MPESEDREIRPEDVPALARAARLPLDPARLPAVAAATDGMLALFDSMDAVDLGETPPTNAFDASWRSEE